MPRQIKTRCLWLLMVQTLRALLLLLLLLLLLRRRQRV